VNKYLPPGDIHDKSKKMLAVLFMMLRGTPFIYQGQEIGMENIQMEHLSDYDDVASHDQYERAIQSGLSEKDAFEMLYRRSRDNSRTPMQWNENTHAGFTTAEKTWLKMHPNYPQINVQKETADPESVLHFYKKLIYLRRKSTYRDIIVYGTFVPMDMGNNNIIAYKRVLDSRVLLVLINMSPESNQINLEQEYVRVVLHNAKESIEISKCLTLEPYAAIILAGAD
jgi:glycosidase